MEITLEMAERLKEKANVSYAQAKEALEYSGGNLLDALIYLEEKGILPRTEGAYFSTRSETPPPAPEPPSLETPIKLKSKDDRPPRGKTRRSVKCFFSALRRWLVDNELEIWRKGQPITALPVLILVLLLCCAPWVTIPVLLLGLFLGFRYRFSGPDLDREDLNNVIGSVADTAADLGRQVMDELRTQHDKHNKDKDGM
ncbi:hypothetical protein D1646_11835 [Pseudoflavonifractor sp. 60]|uniref:hypothetical protein n=1 Tax=Pseudoflavonifractor sp. 60 TaxID=2304576 RepID=UPI001367E055|nr:hypothetical protein [Pseudoflavonifractor sp. 60]NBI67488.1 hypothetical protein [Pseudoflavonifractor sp. 60]